MTPTTTKFNSDQIYVKQARNRNSSILSQLKPLLVFLILLLTIVAPKTSFAQFCATQVTESPNFDQAAFEQFQRQTTNARNNATRNIGITIHIVEEVAGAANIDITKLYEEVDDVNRFFSAAGLRFFICGAPRKVSGRDIYTYSEADRALNPSNHVANTINIFYVDEIGDRLVSSACGISTFPWDGKASTRFILMQKDCSTNGTVLAHELGHFFGLLHTHETFRGRELADGSNCKIAGDLICDTPADPNLGAVDLDGCTYTANFVDFKGNQYRPDPTNIMSYAPIRCTNRFSIGQNDLANFYLETTDLADLIDNCDFYPDFAITTEMSDTKTINTGQVLELSYQFDNEGIEEAIEVEIAFQLKEENGLITFTVHRETLLIQPGDTSFTASFNIELPLDKGTGTYTLTAALDPNSLIQERDKRNNFYVTTLSVDNSSLPDEILFPNPVQERLKLFLRDKRNSGDLTVFIRDYMGRTYYSEKRFKKDEELFVNSDISALQEGFYILTLYYQRNGNSQSFMIYKE